MARPIILAKGAFWARSAEIYMLAKSDDTSVDNGKIDFRCTMGNVLFERLNRHISRLERMGQKKITKNAWVEEAICEKWGKEKRMHPQDVPKERAISLKLPRYLAKGINLIVEFIKKYRRSYSKKQWVVEAIEEKLAQEGRTVDEWLHNPGVILEHDPE